MNPEESKTVKYREVNPPHIHIGFTKNELMLKTFLMLSIIAVFSVIVMGVNAFIHILIALGTVLIVHSLIYSYQKMKNISPTYETPTSPLVAGMIVGLCMPIASPFYTTAGVALLTILLFKYGQGKYFDRKYLNPAAAAKVLALVVLSILFFLDEPLKLGMIFHPHHLDLNLWTSEGFNASMWIFERENLFGQDLSAAQSLFFWQTHGWIGGACGIVVLIVGSIAAYWLRYKWRIIVSSLLTMTGLSIIIGLFQGDIILRIAFHVFTGSFIFMVFFMATEPQSTPMPEISQYIFGISLAILTFFLQLLNVLGGSIIALVALNALTPYLDKIIMKRPYGHVMSKGDA